MALFHLLIAALLCIQCKGSDSREPLNPETTPPSTFKRAMKCLGRCCGGNRGAADSPPPADIIPPPPPIANADPDAKSHDRNDGKADVRNHASHQFRPLQQSDSEKLHMRLLDQARNILGSQKRSSSNLLDSDGSSTLQLSRSSSSIKARSGRNVDHDERPDRAPPAQPPSQYLPPPPPVSHLQNARQQLFDEFKQQESDDDETNSDSKPEANPNVIPEEEAPATSGDPDDQLQSESGLFKNVMNNIFKSAPPPARPEPSDIDSKNAVSPSASNAEEAPSGSAPEVNTGWRKSKLSASETHPHIDVGHESRGGSRSGDLSFAADNDDDSDGLWGGVWQAITNAVHGDESASQVQPPHQRTETEEALWDKFRVKDAES